LFFLDRRVRLPFRRPSSAGRSLPPPAFFELTSSSFFFFYELPIVFNPFPPRFGPPLFRGGYCPIRITFPRLSGVSSPPGPPSFTYFPLPPPKEGVPPSFLCSCGRGSFFSVLFFFGVPRDFFFLQFVLTFLGNLSFWALRFSVFFAPGVALQPNLEFWSFLPRP